MEDNFAALNIIRQLDPIDRLASMCIGLHFRRPHEILALQASNFDFKNMTFMFTPLKSCVRLRQEMKTNFARKCKIHDDLILALLLLCSRHGAADYIFSNDPSRPGEWSALSKKITQLATSAGLNATSYWIVRGVFIKYAVEEISPFNRN